MIEQMDMTMLQHSMLERYLVLPHVLSFLFCYFFNLDPKIIRFETIHLCFEYGKALKKEL